MFRFSIINLLNEKFIEQNFHNVQKKGVGCEKLNPGKKGQKTQSYEKGKTMLSYVVVMLLLMLFNII